MGETQHKLGDIFLRDGEEWCLIGTKVPAGSERLPRAYPLDAGVLTWEIVATIPYSDARIRDWLHDKASRQVAISTGDELQSFEAKLLSYTTGGPYEMISLSAESATTPVSA
jgi:hypothetical protein